MIKKFGESEDSPRSKMSQGLKSVLHPCFWHKRPKPTDNTYFKYYNALIRLSSLTLMGSCIFNLAVSVKNEILG